METTLTRIGNSKGIIIPAKLIKECGFDHKIDIQIKDGSLILSKQKKPRKGWEDALHRSATENDHLIDEPIINDFDETEWTW